VTAAEVLSGARRWAVHHGDCLPWLATLPDGCVQHVITDPPYEAEAHTKQRRSLKDATQKRGAANSGDVRYLDSELPFAAIDEGARSAAAAQFARVAARWSVVFCQIEAVFVWRAALVAGGAEWIRGGVWRKPDGMPQFTGDRPGQGFESLAIAHPKGRKRWNGGGKHAVWTHGLEHGHGGGGRNQHPTQKPLRLMMELLADFTDPDDIILDPFAGSGTTGVAALRLGRRFIGCELDAKYHAVACERLAAEASGSTLQAARAGQVPMFGGAR
jgi:site-specific DNA-methyltransferase (adenine-specific)